MGVYMNRIIVALDGPAGAGKSTISKLVGERLGLEYIDTGAMYRAVTYKVIEDKVNIDSDESLEALMNKIQITFKQGRILLDNCDISEEIRHPRINEKVSEVAAKAIVRKKLVELQRQMSLNINVIMDGRDIGTHVLTNANYKIYLTASVKERANRRFKELLAKGIDIGFDEVSQEILDRDNYDMNRELQPLRKAEDAIEVDTTGKSIDEVVNEILEIISYREQTNVI
jgi:cytidylate kinase